MTDLVEEETRKNAYHLQPYKGYSPESIYEICKGLIADAEAAGYKNCYLKFESTIEPYENYPGNPKITAWGFRKKYPHEIAVEEDRKDTQNLAKKLGISFYEASVLKKNKDKLGLV